MSDLTYNEFSSISGCDIHASFGNVKFADLQMIRYAINREKGQVWTFGNANARATARGKRSISGACVFTLISRDNLVKAMQKATGGSNMNSIFLSHDELANYANEGNQITNELSPEKQRAFRSGGTLGDAGLLRNAQTFNPFATNPSMFDSTNFGKTTQAYLADQLLPFDITIVGASEYSFNNAKRLIIHGVEFMSEASGTSIDDMVIEKQMAFLAKSVSDWMPLKETTITGTANNG